jgi:hypothetical protein
MDFPAEVRTVLAAGLEWYRLRHRRPDGAPQYELDRATVALDKAIEDWSLAESISRQSARHPATRAGH